MKAFIDAIPTWLIGTLLAIVIAALWIDDARTER